MHLAPARILTFTDAATGAEIFSTPMPTLAQIEACIRLDAPTPEAGAAEAPLARHRRYVEQLLALVVPAELPADAPLRTERRAFLRSLQYPQLIDLYRKLMLPVQGIDFDTIEKPGQTFTLRERDSMAQRRITEAELFALLDEQVY